MATPEPVVIQQEDLIILTQKMQNKFKTNFMKMIEIFKEEKKPPLKIWRKRQRIERNQ